MIEQESARIEVSEKTRERVKDYAQDTNESMTDVADESINNLDCSCSSSGSSNSLLANGNNTGINVQTDTNQKQDCETAGETSPITTSWTASSTNTIAQSGGILHK
ncbi:MAG: hypothetical protein WBZ36_21530 [Candidatus Nitrosopolaris sp.]